MATLIAAPTGLVLTGCSSPGDLTRAEYGAMGIDEQSAVAMDLRSAHDLDPTAIGNTIGLTEAILQYCGPTGIDSPGSRLEEITDWDSGRWSGFPLPGAVP